MIAKNIDPTIQPLPTLEELKTLALSDLEQWRKLIITGGARLPFGSSTSYQSHPLRAFFEKRKSRLGDYFQLDLFLLLAEHFGYIETAERSGDFVSMKDRLLKVFPKDHFSDFAALCAADRPDVDAYLSRLVSDAIEGMRSAIFEVAHDVAMGLPMYRELAGDGWARVEDGELPAAYLTGKWNYDQEGSGDSFTFCLPSWIEGHGFKGSDIEALSLFFESWELTPQQVAARRVAYRAHIGLEDKQPAAPAERSALEMGSKLMQELQAVRDRYYNGARFSINNRDTWPKQTTVVEWLKTERGLSEREATAVDVVARPDEIRGK